MGAFLQHRDSGTQEDVRVGPPAVLLHVSDQAVEVGLDLGGVLVHQLLDLPGNTRRELVNEWVRE